MITRLKTNIQALHVDIHEHKEEHARLQQHFQVCACRCDGNHFAMAAIDSAHGKVTALNSSLHGNISAEPV